MLVHRSINDRDADCPQISKGILGAGFAREKLLAAANFAASATKDCSTATVQVAASETSFVTFSGTVEALKGPSRNPGRFLIAL
jgi:hypothetical protein